MGVPAVPVAMSRRLGLCVGLTVAIFLSQQVPTKDHESKSSNGVLNDGVSPYLITKYVPILLTAGVHCKKRLVVLTIVGLPQLQLSCMLSIGYITRRRCTGQCKLRL